MPPPPFPSFPLDTHKKTGKAGDHFITEGSTAAAAAQVSLPGRYGRLSALCTASSPFRPGGPHPQRCHAWRHPPQHLAWLPGTPQPSPRPSVSGLNCARTLGKRKTNPPKHQVTLIPASPKQPLGPGASGSGKSPLGHKSQPLSKLVKTGGAREERMPALYLTVEQAEQKTSSFCGRGSKGVRCCPKATWRRVPSTQPSAGHGTQVSSPAHTNSSGSGPTRQVSVLP